MKNLLTTFLILISLTTHSQGWQLLNPSPTFNNIKSVSFPSADTGYVSDGFDLYKTLDGGESWKLMYLPLGYIRDMQFSSPDKGFLLQGGSVFVTENGGETWTEHDLTWDRLDKVYIKGEMVYVYGRNERMYRSLDGGNTWNFMSVSIWYDTYIVEMEMADELNGYLVSFSGEDDFWLRRTTDGGVYWNEQYWPVMPRTLAVRGPDELYVAGEEDCDVAPCLARIYHTTDGCLTWDTIYVGTSLTTPVVAEALHFFNDMEGYMANDLQTFTTSDGGETWATATMAGMFPEGYNLNVHSWPDPLHGYIGGEGGLLVKTSDRGLTYSSMSQGFNTDLKEVCFLDTLTGFISGDDYPQPVILRTTDGGFTWDTCTMEMPAVVTGMAFTDDLHGWATFGDGIFVTSDGGLNWNIGYYLPEQMRFTEISAPDEDHLYAFSPTAVTFSDDGGYNWVDRSPFLWFSGGYMGKAMSFADSLTGYYILQKDNYMVVAKTVDGGVNWSELLAGDRAYLSAAVDFYDADNGVLYIGDSVKVTHDGGQTWLPYDFWLPASLLMPDPQIVIVVYPGGTIMASYNGGISYSLVVKGKYDFNLSNEYYILDEDHAYAIGDDGMLMRFSAYYTGVSSPEAAASGQPDAPFYYPNPAGESITITGPGISTVSIHSMSGQNIMSCTAHTGETISLDMLPEGLYLITLTTPGSRRVQKLVKM